jgi:branched-chain amino acid transport system permease protein
MARTLGILLVCLGVAYGLNWVLFENIEDYYVHIINLCGISIILAVSLNVVNGLAGQFSLGHAGFMAVGAYTSAYLTTRLTYFDVEKQEYVTQAPILEGLQRLLAESVGLGSGPAVAITFLVALAFAGAAASLVALAVGTPTLKLKGDYLAIATLGVGEIIMISLQDIEKIGGAAGLSNIPTLPALPGIGEVPGLGVQAGASATFWIFGVACSCVLCSLNLQRSTFGRALIAVRENEVAAEMMGLRATRLKVMAFVYGAFFAGMAGALFAHYRLFVVPKDFDWVRSIEVIVMLVLGGIGSLTGAVIGAISMTILPEALRPVEEQLKTPGIRMVAYSLVLILLMLFRPQGLFGQRELSLKLLRRFLPGSRKGDT